MSKTLKIAVLAFAVAAASSAANADKLLDELAAQGSIVTTHGISGAR